MSENILSNKWFHKKFSGAIKSNRFWIILGVIGIWTQVVLTLVNKPSSEVYIKGGHLSKVGSINKVEQSIDIGNTVDINLHSINGYRNCFYNSYSKHPNDYYRIPISY